MRTDLVDLDEAARLTCFTRLDLGRLVVSPESPVTIITTKENGKTVRGIPRETLRGVGGYQPPKPKPAPIPRSEVPPPKEAWRPPPAMLATLIRLPEDERGRQIAILAKTHPEIRTYLRANPMPPFFRPMPRPVPPQPQPTVERQAPPVPEPVSTRPVERRAGGGVQVPQRQMPTPTPAKPAPRPAAPTQSASPLPTATQRMPAMGVHLGLLLLGLGALAVGLPRLHLGGASVGVAAVTSPIRIAAACDPTQRRGDDGGCKRGSPETSAVQPARPRGGTPQSPTLRWVFDKEGHLQLVRQP